MIYEKEESRIKKKRIVEEGGSTSEGEGLGKYD